jgi:hypothetical protein
MTDTRATVAPGELKGSMMYGIGVCLAILSVGLMSVITPFLGPPAAEVAALNQAQQTQALAHSWVAMHPEDAVPTGDPRAWGFYDPSAPAESAPCAQFWADSTGAC